MKSKSTPKTGTRRPAGQDESSSANPLTQIPKGNIGFRSVGNILAMLREMPPSVMAPWLDAGARMTWDDTLRLALFDADGNEQTLSTEMTPEFIKLIEDHEPGP